MLRLGLVCVAAGRSRRLPADRPKAFLPVAGRPLFQHALACFAHRPDLAQIVLVAPAEEVERLRASCDQWTLSGVPTAVVAGGPVRADSVCHGLEALAPAIDLVAIHDAARPLTPARAIDEAITAAAAYGAAIVATALRDTLKRVESDGRVIQTLQRNGLWQAQTPQVFRRALIQRAYACRPRAGAAAPDDAALVEAMGAAVCVVEGTLWNFKVTFPEDLALAEWLLKRASPRCPPEGE